MTREIENTECVRVYNECFELCKRMQPRVRWMNNCMSWVIRCGKYVILCSCATFVAALDEDTGIMYDFVRYTPYYNSITEQRIAKFRHIVEPRAYLRYYP